MLRLFVRLELFDEDQAETMLRWPHSGFHVHDAVWVAEDDRTFAWRLARHCDRDPVALERLTYDALARRVTYRSDKSEGLTAGTETTDPLEFPARVLTHIPDKGQVTTRYYGWYANRPRGLRRQICEVDPFVCPRCGGTMRMLALITERGVIDQILTHLRTRATAPTGLPGPRSPPAHRAASTRHRRVRTSATANGTRPT